MPLAPSAPSSLLAAARAGDGDALGRLLEDYRHYLRLLARSRVGRELRVRVDPSDLVQETLLEAQRDFGQFEGASGGELGVWLRQVLVRNLADQAKHHHSQKRDFGREEPLESLTAPDLAAPLSTPSAAAVRREQAGVLAAALAQLPADYREVVTQRHLEGQSFEAIAARMGRTSGAVRMLWLRALERLGGMMETGDASA